MELHLLFLMFPRRRKALIALTTNQLVTFTEDLFSLFQLCGTTERQAFFFRNRTKMFRLKGSRNPSSCLPSLRPLFVTCWKPIEKSASFFYFLCALFVASIHTFRVYDTLVPTNYRKEVYLSSILADSELGWLLAYRDGPSLE